jgi:hypothetical protein
MHYKRIHVRVPLSGEALLSSGQDAHIRAHAIDISQGGVGIASTSKLQPNIDYSITLTTKDRQKIELTGQLIRNQEDTAAFQTTHIKEESIHIINELVAEYQATTAYIQQIEEHNLLDNLFLDEDGNEIVISFDIET